MTVYADYDFYEREYLSGKAAVVPAEQFAHYARKSSSCITQYTFGALDKDAETPECVKSCCCELAELFYQHENSPTAHGVVSEKVGDISVSYESAGSQRQALPKTIKSVVYSWLADTGLLYTGGRLC